MTLCTNILTDASHYGIYRLPALITFTIRGTVVTASLCREWGCTWWWCRFGGCGGWLWLREKGWSPRSYLMSIHCCGGGGCCEAAGDGGIVPIKNSQWLVSGSLISRVYTTGLGCPDHILLDTFWLCEITIIVSYTPVPWGGRQPLSLLRFFFLLCVT